jgi:hypothetical protein
VDPENKLRDEITAMVKESQNKAAALSASIANKGHDRKLGGKGAQS